MACHLGVNAVRSLVRNGGHPLFQLTAGGVIRRRPLVWIGSVGLGLVVGLLTPLAIASEHGQATLLWLAASVALVGGIALTFRWPWLPVVLYWFVYSFVSDLRLLWQFTVGPVPVTGPDLVVAAIAIAAGVQSLRQRSFGGNESRVVWLGLLGLLCLCLASIVIGLSRNYPWYSIVIDLRDICYLLVGYLAAQTVLHARRDRRVLSAVLWMSVVGFVVEQTAVSFTGFGNIALQGGSLASYRDIGVSFFTGKYGTLLAIVVIATAGVRASLGAVTLAIAGFAATATSLVRTAWLDLAAGIAFLLVAMGLRAGGRLMALLVIAVAAFTVAVNAIPQTNVIVTAVIERSISALDPNSSSAVDTLSIRFDESRAALSHLQSPLDWVVGAGIGLSVQDSLHPYQHNSYVWYLSKMGVIGLVAMCAVLVLLPLAIAVKGLRVVAGRRRTLLLTLTAAHVANVVSGFASGHLTNWEYAPIVGMTIGWLVQLALPEATERISGQDSDELGTEWHDPHVVSPQLSASQSTRPRRSGWS